MPMSPVTRAIPAMSRVDSIFHTASIALCVSLMPECRSRRCNPVRKLLEAFGFILHVCGEITHFVNLPHFHDLVVGHRCSPGPFDRFFPRAHLNDPVASNSLFVLSERPIGNRCLLVSRCNPLSQRMVAKPC